MRKENPEAVSTFPEDLRYTKDHEWVRLDRGVYTVGITSHATEQLGDVTYVELPEVGAEFGVGDEAGTVESVKAASDVYAPVGGQVTEVNGELEDAPERVNESPFEAGWFFKLNAGDLADFDALMDAGAYETFVQELDH
jgi:glycine cleavage system H protein